MKKNVNRGLIVRYRKLKSLEEAILFYFTFRLRMLSVQTKEDEEGLKREASEVANREACRVQHSVSVAGWRRVRPTHRSYIRCMDHLDLVYIRKKGENVYPLHLGFPVDSCFFGS